MLTKISSELPVLMINHFFNSMAVGSYALANRVLVTPLSIISSSFSQVYVKQLLSLEGDDDKYSAINFYKKTLFSTMIISLPFFILAFIFMPSVFEFIFGKDWRVAGMYCQALLPMLYFRFAGSIVATSVIVYKQQKMGLVLELVSALSRFVSLLVGGVFKDIFLGLLLFSISSSLVTIYRLFWYNQFIGGSSRYEI